MGHSLVTHLHCYAERGSEGETAARFAVTLAGIEANKSTKVWINTL